MACGTKAHKESADALDEKRTKEPAKMKYELRVLSQPEKGKKAVYQLPDIKKVEFRELRDLIESILLCGSDVHLELVSGEITEDTDPKDLERGTHVLKVEPQVFKAGETIRITVINYAARS
jgi:hypothetical protein